MDALSIWCIAVRLLINKEWFDAVSSEGQYESNFESIVVNNAALLFPEYHTLPFRVRVESEAGAKIPDLVLIDKQYRHWWVVEIEMAHHSLNGHVLPQVEVFASGKYGLEHAEYIVTHSPTVATNPTLIYDMIKGAQPRVLVVVNKSMPSWAEAIRRFQGLVSVVEVFRSSRNHHAFRINGDNPATSAAYRISLCRLDHTLPRLLQIDSPAALGITHGQHISITFRGGLTEWERIDVSNQVWLSPIGRNPFEAGRDYCIVRDDDGNLYFDET